MAPTNLPPTSPLPRTRGWSLAMERPTLSSRHSLRDALHSFVAGALANYSIALRRRRSWASAMVEDC